MARLEVISGPMFYGKSEEVVRRLVRLAFARKTILVIRPKMDDRKTRNIFDLIKENRHLKKYKNITTGRIDSFQDLQRLIAPEAVPDVIAVDEMQFVGDWIVNSANELLDMFENQDFRLIVSGLDMDAFKNPFGPMPQLMAMADEVVKLTAICNKCETNTATLTYKLGGSPNQQVEVGDKDIYQARCRACHKLSM